MNSTFTCGVQLLLTGQNSRRTMFSGNAGILVSNSFDFQELALAPQANSNYSGATQAFAIDCDGPLQVALLINNVYNVFTISSLFIVTAPVSEITLTNNSASIVNARLAFVS